MISSSIYKELDYFRYPEAIQTAVNYLKQNDFIKMEPGVYEIQGKDIYAQVFDEVTEPADKKRPEVHEKFADVQFLASGKEKLGFTTDTGIYKAAERIDERDLIFYENVENESFINAVPGCYNIFFPGDIHRPGVEWDGSKTIRKVVVKVKMDLLK